MKPLFLRKIWDKITIKFPKFAYEVNYFRKYHNYEQDLWLIPNFCSKTSDSIDIGGNRGIFSRWMSKYSKNVHVFECNPNLFKDLEELLPINCILYGVALSNTNGETVLRFDSQNTGIGTIEASNKLDQNIGIKEITSVTVKMIKLDSLSFNNKISFIKIDVEGHELEVLKGAFEVLKKNHPTLLIEIEDRHCPGNIENVPKWLSNLNYQPYILNENNELVQTNNITTWANKGYNNFWFR